MRELQCPLMRAPRAPAAAGGAGMGSAVGVAAAAVAAAAVVVAVAGVATGSRINRPCPARRPWLQRRQRIAMRRRPRRCVHARVDGPAAVEWSTLGIHGYIFNFTR